MSGVMESKRWYTASELAGQFGTTPSAIEALARRHHWSRVTRADRIDISVDLDTVRRALGATPSSVHGSVTPQ